MPNRKCRIVVFVDGQNVQNDFRRAFAAPSSPSREGAFNPRLLAERLVDRGPDFEDWELVEIRAYVGSPVAQRQPIAAAAHDRQMETWRAWGVTTRPRPLYYPFDWPTQRARQKGVDVEMAVDIFRMAIAREYEVAIVMSTDKDMLPAIEAVHKLREDAATPRVCVVRYGDAQVQLRSTDSRGRKLYCFQLTRDDYEAVADRTDYTRQRSSETDSTT